MSETASTFAASGEGDRIRSLWEDAAEAGEPTQTAAKAPLFGVNLRLDVMKALQATWETAGVAARVWAVAHAPFDAEEWLEISVEGAAAVRSIVSSLVQQLGPLEYVVYVILSHRHPRKA